MCGTQSVFIEKISDTVESTVADIRKFEGEQVSQRDIDVIYDVQDGIQTILRRYVADFAGKDEQDLNFVTFQVANLIFTTAGAVSGILQAIEDRVAKGEAEEAEVVVAE